MHNVQAASCTNHASCASPANHSSCASNAAQTGKLGKQCCAIKAVQAAQACQFAIEAIDVCNLLLKVGKQARRQRPPYTRNKRKAQPRTGRSFKDNRGQNTPRIGSELVSHLRQSNHLLPTAQWNMPLKLSLFRFDGRGIALFFLVFVLVAKQSAGRNCRENGEHLIQATAGVSDESRRPPPGHGLEKEHQWRAR